ncbi:DNA binding protein [Onygenales sp. PD_40]|nr:DNA binding protein [Onygenales sp. PD_40]
MARVIFTEQSQRATAKAPLSNAPNTTTAVVQAQAQKEKQQQAQAIRQEQSLALVQIMLHASLGTLFYLREFLPMNCFADRDLVKLSKANSDVSYDDFVEGNMPPRTSGSTNMERRGQPLKVIVRDRCPKADKLLDLLEDGIFDALEKNFLEAVQMTIFVEKDKPSQILESYTFTFKYTGGPNDVNSRLASISLDATNTGCTAEMKTLRTAQRGLEMIIRRLITLSAFLPILPSQRYMEIHLFYTDTSPPGYEPPGFKTAEHDDLLFARNELWSRETQSCGAMDTGIHGVGLKVTSLKWSGDDLPGADTPEIPADIEYTDRFRREEDIGISQDETMQDLGQSRTTPASTQTRQDEAMRKGLENMLPVTSTPPESSLLPTQCNSQPAPGQKAYLSQAKMTQLESRMKEFSMTDSLQYDMGGASMGETNAGAVRCECEVDTENPEMLQCTFCNTRQHTICYGFIHGQDPAIPDTHVCYKCLLEPSEKKLLQDMRTLVLLRRAIAVIIDQGYPNRVKDFAQKLGGCNGQTIVQITDLLRKQGLLHATPGSKSKGFLEKGLPKFTLSTTPAMKDKIRKDIFNPLAKISHHYYIPTGTQQYTRHASGRSTVSPAPSSDDELIEQIPPTSPDYEARKLRLGSRTSTSAAPEVLEIREAFKSLNSALPTAPALDKPDIQLPPPPPNQPSRTESGSRGVAATPGSSRGRRPRLSEPMGGWVAVGRGNGNLGDSEDEDGDEDEGGYGNGNGVRKKKRARLSYIGSPISIFEPSESEGSC